MLSFSPTSVFSSVDLPTFGLPTIATNPQRPSLASLALTGQYHEHRRGSVLLSCAPALPSTDRLNILISNFTFDHERLLMIAAVHGRHRVRRQRQTPALQPLLQPRLRILERRRIGQARKLSGEHEIDDSFCRRCAAVKQHRADQI